MSRAFPGTTRTVSARRLVGAAAAAGLIVGLLQGQGLAVPTFSAPVQVTGLSGYEPGIDIAPDGTIYVNGPSGNSGIKSVLARSTNGGASYEQLPFGTVHSKFPGGFDTDVAVTEGPDGNTRVYFLDLWVVSNSVSRSDDGGTTWGAGTPFTTLPASDRQWIGIGSRNALTDLDTVYVIYALIQPPSPVMFARSDDGGQTWPIHRPLPGLFGGSTGFTGNMVTDGDYVGFLHEDGGDLNFSYSTNAGLIFETREVNTFSTNSFHAISSVALDGDNVYATWTDATDHAVHVARSTNRGNTWSEIDTVDAEFVVLSTAGTSNVFPWIDARGGKVAVAWYSTASVITSKAPDDQNGGQWKVYYAESFDGGINFTAPAQVSTGTVKTGPICTIGLGCSLSTGLEPAPGNRQLGDFMGLALHPTTNKAFVVFGDNNGTRAKVARQS